MGTAGDARAHRIDLLDQARYQSYLARPALFADELRAVPPRATVVVVDEIQRLPHLLNEVHRFIGERRLATEDGIEVWPVAALLEALDTGTLWP